MKQVIAISTETDADTKIMTENRSVIEWLTDAIIIAIDKNIPKPKCSIVTISGTNTIYMLGWTERV